MASDNQEKSDDAGNVNDEAVSSASPEPVIKSTQDYDRLKALLESPEVTVEEDNSDEGDDASDEEVEDIDLEETAEDSEEDDGNDDEVEEVEDSDDETSNDEEEAHDDEDSESDVEEEHTRKEKPWRGRLSLNDQVEKETIELKKRNPDLSLKECMERAEKKLGVNQTSDDHSSEKDLPPSAASIEAKIDELWNERTKALGEDMDFEKAAKLDSDIRIQERELRKAQEREVRDQHANRSASEQQYMESFESSKAKAEELYSFMKDATSAEFKRMAEIDADLKEAGDDLYYDPNKPLKVAQMVARERNIPPRSKQRKVVKPTAKPRPKSVVQPASHSARTVTSTGSTLDKLVDKVSSVEDYEALQRALGKS